MAGHWPVPPPPQVLAKPQLSNPELTRVLPAILIPSGFQTSLPSACLSAASLLSHCFSLRPPDSQSAALHRTPAPREVRGDPETVRHEAQPAGGGECEETAQGSPCQVPNEWYRQGVLQELRGGWRAGEAFLEEPRGDL